MILRKSSLFVLFAVALLGCNDGSSNSAGTAASQPKVDEFETGRFALQKMLNPARLWNPDAAPVMLSSTATAASNGHDGKAVSWRSVFASRARQKSEPFIWSGLASATRKVDHGIEDSYSPNNLSMQTWDLNFIKIDTDQAFAVAQEHGGKKILEEDPQLPVTYLLDFDASASQLRWHVMYGSNPTKLTIIVDASSARFLHKE